MGNKCLFDSAALCQGLVPKRCCDAHIWERSECRLAVLYDLYPILERATKARCVNRYDLFLAKSGYQDLCYAPCRHRIQLVAHGGAAGCFSHYRKRVDTSRVFSKKQNWRVSEYLPKSDTHINDRAARVFMSNWQRRLWTLQESIFAKKTGFTVARWAAASW